MNEHIIFYVPAGSITDADAVIKGPELMHIRGALRRRVGERICLTDGHGYQYEAEIGSLARSSIGVKILNKRRMPRKIDVEITLAFVPVKGMRNDMIIEKGTELGVFRFVLFPSRRSVLRNIGSQKIARLMKIAQSAMAQSRQYYMPQVSCVDAIDDLLAKDKSYDRMYVADPAGQKVFPSGGRKMLLLVGPEGGFTESEMESFAQRGVQAIGLGSTRLRSETAAIVGITKILVANGEI